MSTPTWSVAPDVDASVAFDQMQRSGIRHLVVVQHEHVIGVISQRDLGGRSGALAPGKTVGELMSSAVVVVAPETSVARAAHLMRGESIGCLPVVDGKELVGIVTTADLLAFVARQPAPRARRERVHLARRMDT